MAKTAAELMAELAKNKQFQSDQKAREEKTRSRERLYRTDEKGLVEELNAAGFEVRSVWDFVNSDNDYIAAVPILSKHLKVEHHPKVLAGIARSLAIQELAGDDEIWSSLVKLYTDTLPDQEIETPEERGVQQAVAVALEALATEEKVGALESIILGMPHADGIEWLQSRLVEFKRLES